MVSVVLVMHQPLGAAFAQCVKHVLGGQQPGLHVVDIAPDADVDLESARLTQQLLQFGPPGCLVLCDLYGATPFNIAQRAVTQASKQGVQASILSGANLYMVLKALTDPVADPHELGARVRARILRGIVGSDNPAE